MSTAHAPVRPPRLVQRIGREGALLANQLAERRRQLEAARAKRRAIRAGATRDLVMFEHYGSARQLRVEATDEACESCARLVGRVFTFTQARDVLPNRECTNPLGWCDCTWAAERRTRPR